ncbi:MAG: hypothetical protein AAGJ32_02570 [Pseudomonadota bacterium]
MSIQPPARISRLDARLAELDPADIGAWAVLVCGCFHIFESERAAQRAYRLWLENRPVR